MRTPSFTICDRAAALQRDDSARSAVGKQQRAERRGPRRARRILRQGNEERLAQVGPSIVKAQSEPALTSSATAAASTMETPRPAATACFTASVEPSSETTVSRDHKFGPKVSRNSRPVPVPGSPPISGSPTSSSKPTLRRAARAWSGGTMTTSGSDRQATASKPGSVPHHSVTATSTSPRSSRAAMTGFGAIESAMRGASPKRRRKRCRTPGSR